MKESDSMKNTYDGKFKSRVVLEAIPGNRTIAEMTGEYNIHLPSQQYPV